MQARRRHEAAHTANPHNAISPPIYSPDGIRSRRLCSYVLNARSFGRGSNVNR